ncbi:MAG: phosphoribosylglycinamide formyltransferase [Ilumatobacteraceae bacterium]
MSPATPARLVVLASGNGSNFQVILDAIAAGSLDAEVVALITDKPGACAAVRAAAGGITPIVLAATPGEDRGGYDTRLAASIASLHPDLVVLAGWMRLLTMNVLGHFPRRVINLHPALPGEFPGTNAIERALVAARDHGLRRTGVTVHHVPDEGVDSGPVIATVEVPITDDDTLTSLSARMHAAEHELIVSALRDVISTLI